MHRDYGPGVYPRAIRTRGSCVALPFVLIDLENVQPKILDRLRPGTCRVKVSLGQQQDKLMLELVQRRTQLPSL
jgi:hypothetical protein